jgi:hypothetical protein
LVFRNLYDARKDKKKKQLVLELIEKEEDIKKKYTSV